MQAHLLFDAFAGHGVAAAIWQQLRHQEKRQPFGAVGCTRQARQHQVHDVVGQVVFTAGNKNLGATDLVVRCAVHRHGLGAHQAQVAPGLGLGEAHGGQPFAAGDLRQVSRLQRIAAVVAQAFIGAVQQAGRHGPAMVGGGQPFVEHAFQHPGQALAAVLLGAGQRGPAGSHKGLVGVAETRWCGDGTGLPAATHFITLPRQRRHHLGHKLARLVQHLLHQRLVGLGQPLQGLQLHRCLQHVEEQETGVGEGGLVRHGLLSKTELYAEVFPAREALFVQK